MAEDATVLSFATGEPVKPEAAAIERFVASLADGSWFSSLGLPPTSGEVADAEAYLAGLGMGALAVTWISDVERASRLAQDDGWSRAWWQAEEQAIGALTAKLDAALGKTEATALLNQVMGQASNAVMGPAAVAMSRVGIADQGLNRALAGAATQAAYGMALAVGVNAGANASRDLSDDPLAAKYRLFAAGHWPLVVIEGEFYVL